MSREILSLVEALANEKKVTEEIVFGALEFALATAMKKQPGHEDMDIKVSIDRETGDYHAIRRWLIVEDTQYNDQELQKTIEQIQEEIPGIEIQVGDYYEEPIEAVEFGRIGAQTAKQVILQRIRDAEREQILEEFLQRRESIIRGTVKRSDNYSTIIEIERLEAILPRDQRIRGDHWRPKDHVRALFLRVDKQGHRSNVILTRTSEEFLIKLFEVEVPEIGNGSIEIKAIARDPGVRSKIAVKSNDSRIGPQDLQGTCIGVKSSRINAVSRELNNERIDVILWSPDPAKFVINALSPAKVSRILIDESNHSMDVIVDEQNLASIIGRNGQNIRLASELTGWILNVTTEEEAEQRYQAEDNALRALFISNLHISEELADVLVEEEFRSVEEIAYLPIDEMLDIDGFDLDLVEDLRERAREAIRAKEEAKKELYGKVKDEYLDKIVTNLDVLRHLIEADICTRDDLADLSTSELVDITGVSEEEAVELITQARAHWFNQEDSQGEVHE